MNFSYANITDEALAMMEMVCDADCASCRDVDAVLPDCAQCHANFRQLIPKIHTYCQRKAQLEQMQQQLKEDPTNTDTEGYIQQLVELVAMYALQLGPGICMTVHTLNKGLTPDPETPPTSHDDDCSVCLDPLPDDSQLFKRLLCCGKGLHVSCSNTLMKSKLMKVQKSCLMCRAKLPIGAKPTKKQAKKELKQLQDWVKKGKRWAQYLLARSYDTGTGGASKNRPLAVALYTLAADQDCVNAQYNLGHMYRDGVGVEQSFSMAAKYYEMALPNAPAQFSLGSIYINNGHVKAGRALFLKSARAGFEPAINGLQKLDQHQKRTTPSFVRNVDVVAATTCAGCGKAQEDLEVKLKACSRCKLVFYCGRPCQLQHWKHSHKKICCSNYLKMSEKALNQ